MPAECVNRSMWNKKQHRRGYQAHSNCFAFVRVMCSLRRGVMSGEESSSQAPLHN